MRLPRFLKPPPKLHVGSSAFDDWSQVADYEDLETALAFRDRLRDLGIKAELTANYEPDRFGRADISLVVPSDQYGDATVALDGLDLD